MILAITVIARRNDAAISEKFAGNSDYCTKRQEIAALRSQ